MKKVFIHLSYLVWTQLYTLIVMTCIPHLGRRKLAKKEFRFLCATYIAYWHTCLLTKQFELLTGPAWWSNAGFESVGTRRCYLNEGQKCTLFLLSQHLSFSSAWLKDSLPSSPLHPGPPASYKPPWYWLCRGLRCRDLGPPFPVSVHFQHRAAYAEPAVYQQGDISCGECQGSTCDIILLLMAHRVRGLLIPKQTTAQTAPLCVRVCVMSRPPSIESCDSDL